MTPDNWPEETSWHVVESITGVTIAAASNGQSGQACLDPQLCYEFTILDSYGDGILGSGGYVVLVDETQVATGSSFQYQAFHWIGCEETG